MHQTNNSRSGNECLLSSSSSSTSSSSSANQHNHNHNQPEYNNNNNNTLTPSKNATEPLNFNSRSLGAFQAANNYSSSSGAGATHNDTSKHKPTLKPFKNSATNGSETNLSVKTAVKVFESGSNSGLVQGLKNSNTYSSHTSLNHTPKHTLQPSAKQAAGSNNSSNSNNLHGSALSFNKQKRSSSIDNVISSFTSNSSQHFHGKPYFNSSHVHESTSNNSKNTLATKEASPSFANPRNSSHLSTSNLFLTGTDLKDLLESFNINTSKLTGNVDNVGNHTNRSNLEESYMNSQGSMANRSRSLHRDGSSYYVDVNGQRKKLNGESSHKLKNVAPSPADQSYSAFNSSSILSQRSQYESDSNQNVLYNSSDLNSSSHVVPKPPPGNPQRNTNLYPAARWLFSSCITRQ